MGIEDGDRWGAGEPLRTFAVKGWAGLARGGDDLWLAAELPHRAGGRLPMATPGGPREIWVGRRDIARGLVRLTGQGLPARGPHAAGDRIVFYSAGIPEAVDGRGQVFGGERLLDALELGRPAPLGTVVEDVFGEVTRWCGDAGFRDDVSLLAVESMGLHTGTSGSGTLGL